MDPYLFSAEWAAACQTEINASEAYREAGATWEGAVVFVVDKGEHPARGVYVDLWRGECREARALMDGDPDLAPYVIAGDPDTWGQVLEGTLEPLGALVMGRLRLVKGSATRQEIHVDLKSIMNAKANDVPMQPEDILFIPTSVSKNAALRTLETAISVGTGLALYRY